ncbi:DNA repair ATPase OS=Streptomyces fumanus OX=67302 GN=GCM10018772_47740 PE=4 SV=1 [Streptomyces fumanus]
MEKRREERKAQRAKQSDEARRAKEDLVAEAERLAQSDQWRAAGERLRALVDTWKGLPRLDRKSDDELWHRFSHARSAFSKRRKQHFAQLDAQREEARRIKERLVAEAEELSSSTDWGPTAARYRELMADGRRRAGPSASRGRPVEPPGAQDRVAARSSVFASATPRGRLSSESWPEAKLLRSRTKAVRALPVDHERW